MRLSKSVIVAIAVLCAGSWSQAYTSASKELQHPIEWYRTDEARRLADNLLTWQAPEGGWPKNQDTAGKPHDGEGKLKGTFDNGATFFEMQYLARMVIATGEAKYRQAFDRGLDHILAAQYPSGGWPQSYPPPEGYGRHITFNDGTMARLMFLLRDVQLSEWFTFVSPEKKSAAKIAWEKGIDCILKCQVKVNGVLTVWCSQHDETDYSPRPARVFEPVSLSGQESLAVMNLLMHVENPTPEIIAAVDVAAAWFEAVKIHGIRIEDRPQDGAPKGFERFVVEDPNAPVLWARFYEIGTNRPIFTGRDGVVRYNLADIDIERRTGYRWYGAWAKGRLETEYPAWKAKHSK